MSGGIPGTTQRTFRASGSIWSLIGPAAVFVLMMGFAASAGAVVFCVSPSGSVPSATSKALGCGPTVTKTISAAVGFASGTDSIVVLRGIYAEMVTIPASLSGLTLSAASTVQPTIDANGLQNGILEQANGVTIKGFAIKNAEHEGILVQGPPANCTGSPTTCTAGSGITGVAISNNLIENNDKAFVSSSTTCPAVGSVPAAPDFEQEDCGEGIHLDGVTDSTVANNLVQHNAGGILLTDETGQNRSNVITANLVQNNPTDCGITLASHPPNGSSANIGVVSFGVFNGTVAGNTSQGNGGAGVGIFAPTSETGSFRHLVVDNKLVNNGLPGVAFHSHKPSQDLDDSVVMGNLIEHNGADPNPGTGEADGPSGSTGIEVYADVTASPILLKIVGNTFSNETNDVWVGAPTWSNCGSATLPCYDVGVHLNNFASNSVGINNTGASSQVSVYGTDNYWGCAKGPNAAGCAKTQGTGGLKVVPFLSTSSAIH